MLSVTVRNNASTNNRADCVIYQQMEASLDDDIERVSSVFTQKSAAESDATIQVTLNTTEGQTIQVTVHRGEAIYEAVARCLECNVHKIRYVQLGGAAVGVDGESFQEEEIEDGAKLGVCVVVTLSFEDVVDATVALNPGITPEVTKERLVKGRGYGIVQIDPDDPLHIMGDLEWARMGLTALPDIIGKLKIEGSFYLDCNRIKSLPEGFAHISCRDIRLDNNCLESLPENIGCLCIRGNFFVNSNYLSRLPDSFGEMQIGEGLDLSGNALSTLPESFLDLKVAGIVSLQDNLFEAPYPHYGGIVIEWEEEDEEWDLRAF